MGGFGLFLTFLDIFLQILEIVCATPKNTKSSPYTP